MADKRDLKIKKRKRMTGEKDPSPMAWERSSKKKIIQAKKKEEAKPAVAMTVDETEAADIPLPTRRKKKTNVRRLVKRIIAFVLAAFLAVTVWRNWDNLAPGNLMFWLEQTFAPPGDGFPVEISGNTVLDVQQVQGYMVLLTDTSVVAFNDRGGEVMRRQHNYSKPILITDGAYMLVVEQGGTRFRLDTLPENVLNVTSDNLGEDNKTAVLDQRLENRIISADVQEDGTVALITQSSGSYTSEVVVYNDEGERQYRQRYAVVQAVDVAISDDEEEVAVVGIEAKNGVLQSYLRIYSLQSQETKPIKEYAGQDVLMSRVAYLNGGELVAIGDTQTWVVDPDGDLDKRISYDKQLVGYAVGETEVGLALQKYGASDGGEVMWVTAAGDSAYTAPFVSDFRHLIINEDRLLLLTAGQLYRGDSTGLKKPVPVQQDGRMVGFAEDSAIVLGLTALTEYSEG